jgi:hypothetical protein
MVAIAMQAGTSAASLQHLHSLQDVHVSNANACRMPSARSNTNAERHFFATQAELGQQTC